ncbi:hypothetical protein [Flavobacterium sp. M31R6]|uniref:hypothetical protein n=1 Tax=Flavobacterium sp. M31R6 TaxID=2739062 RepID=UPI001569F4EC|nr:hypothetical protein [Flavobacterium sp. M31R6]QKJ62184.1 hypothetical protein HQN62_03205 [Flavobacterium sp. M31R6]
MKKFTLVIITIMLLMPKQSDAQNTGAAVAAAGAAALVIGAAIMAHDNMEERAELTATQWIIANHPELKSFSLKTLDFDGKKAKDMSSVSVITFKIQEFNPSDNPVLDGKKQVLFCFTSNGWINDQGIDFSRVQWFLIDSDEWMNMMVAYSKVSSSEKNETVIREKLTNGTLVNKGIKVKGKTEIPFFKIEGDMYLVTDYSDEMKLIYNEKSLCFFLKKTGNLVQMGRDDVIKTHEFYFAK